jgi:hypothetical protein
MRADLIFELLFLVLLCYIGLVLIKAGLRGKRVGSTPHCPQCDYDLTGLPGAHCPECGTDVLKKGPVFGERQRRWGFIGTGAISLVTASLLLIPTYQSLRLAFRNEWYHIRPTSVVINDLQDPQLFGHVYSELGRRLRDGRLSDRQKRRAASVIISEMVRRRTGKRVQDGLNALAANSFRAGVVAPQEREALFRSMEAFDVRLEKRTDDDMIWLGQNWVWPPDQEDLGYLPRRVVEIVAFDGQPMRQELMARVLPPGWNGEPTKPLPVRAQRGLVIRVTTTWYDFGPEYSVQRMRKFDLDGYRALLKMLPGQGTRPLCTYVDELTLSPENGWRASQPPPKDPSKAPASLPSR